MKQLVLQAIMSVVYLFDVSAYPFVHVSFYLLTLLYFASLLEIFGMFKLARWLLNRLPQMRRHANSARAAALAISGALRSIASGPFSSD